MSFDIEPENKTCAPDKEEYEQYEAHMAMVYAIGKYAISHNLKTEYVNVIFKLKKESRNIKIDINL